MPTPTYVAIAKTLPTTSPTFIEFTAIPSTYTDLLLVFNARSADTSTYFDVWSVQINGLTTAIYSYTQLNASTTVTSNANSAQTVARGGNYSAALTTSNTFGSGEIYFPNYTGSTNKIISALGVAENNSTTANQSSIGLAANLAQTTSAISSIKLTSAYGSGIVSGSRFDLYGIKNS